VTYGKSEIFNPITVLPPVACDAFYADAEAQAGVSLGWPASGVEIEIRDEAGRALPAGETGEIHLRARHMMLGQIDADGFHALTGQWHATGDMGHRAASGALMFSGRAGDVIKTGGYKVFPAEIEHALAGAAGHAAIAVIGVPSDYWGQVIVAVAEAPPDRWADRARAQAAALTRYKQPRAYLALPVLPRGAQDKLQRAKAVERVLTAFRLQDGPHPRFDPV
jgi:acyl-CoA synthetase (AMP-forming)/AMP-acid ligase II